MPQIVLGNQRIHHELQGSAGGCVLVFINGLTQSTGLWQSYVDHFGTRGYRVLTYDMLGQGLSSKPVLGATLDDHVELLRQLFDALEIERAHVAGISFGGVVALRFALTHPERVMTLIPMSTFSEMTPQMECLGRAMWEALTEAGFPLLQSLLLPMNFSSRWLAANKQIVPELKRRGYILNDHYAIQNLVESFIDFQPFSATLKQIECPTLILNGEWDYLTPRSCHEILRRKIPNSRLMIIQHAYHAFTLEFPEITARVIEEFLRSVEAGSWRGDRSVWVAADDPQARVLASPSSDDHTRAISVPAELETPAYGY